MTKKDKRSQANTVLDQPSLQTIAEAVTPRPLGDDRKTALRERLFARLDGPPAGTRTVHAADLEWEPVLPLVDIKVLHRSAAHNTQTALWRMQPGAVIPGHWHNEEEECWMVEGEISVGGHVLREGDMHVARSGYKHPDFVSENGALFLVRSEIRERPSDA